MNKADFSRATDVLISTLIKDAEADCCHDSQVFQCIYQRLYTWHNLQLHSSGD